MRTVTFLKGQYLGIVPFSVLSYLLTLLLTNTEAYHWQLSLSVVLAGTGLFSVYLLWCFSWGLLHPTKFSGSLYEFGVFFLYMVPTLYGTVAHQWVARTISVDMLPPKAIALLQMAIFLFSYLLTAKLFVHGMEHWLQRVLTQLSLKIRNRKGGEEK